MALTDNIVAYWKLDESSGNASDSSGSGLTLTNVGTLTYGTGKINNGGNFTATKYLDGGDILDFERTDAFSISAWYKTTSLTTQSIITKHGLTSPYSGWSLRLYQLGGSGHLKAIFQLSNNAVSNANILNIETNEDNFDSADFVHIVVTYSGNSLASGVKIYLNNDEQTLITNAQTLSASILNDISLNIGSRADGGGNQFEGMIDEVGVWSRILTSDEVAELYNSGDGLQYPFSSDTATLVSPIINFE